MSLSYSPSYNALSRSTDNDTSHNAQTDHDTEADLLITQSDVADANDLAASESGASANIMSRQPLKRTGYSDYLGTASVGPPSDSSAPPINANLSDGPRKPWTRSPTATSPDRDFSQSRPENFEEDHDGDQICPRDNSIYPEVRASVAPTDNTSLSINTPRMWILTMFFALVGSSSNLLFSLRYPSVNIHPLIALILVHPLGKAWDYLLQRSGDPVIEFENGWSLPYDLPKDLSRVERWRLWLSQGQWNEKEHACVYVGSNVAFGFAFATDVIVEQKKFYQQEVTLGYQILLTLSTQIIGYGLAGVARRYLVRPPSMIWPGLLASTAMFSTLHKYENKPADGWRISRWRFFLYVWLAAFLWYFVPGLLFPALSYFNVLTWLAPDSVVLANLFGVRSGLALFPITFDWAQITYIGSPLLTPWWAAANVVSGLAIIIWIVAPVLYYRNTLYSAFMPITSSSIYDNTGKTYDVTKILTPDFLFDEEAFSRYSPIYLPVTYFLAYAVQFAGLTSLITHTICFHGRDIWRQSIQSFADRPGKEHAYQRVSQQHEDPEPIDYTLTQTPTHSSFHESHSHRAIIGDVHNTLMERYDDVPIAWYILTLTTMLAMAIFVVEYYPTHLPWYGLLLSLSIAAAMFIPIAIIMAIANQHFSLYLVAQLICGYAFPGRPVANMVFTVYCYISSSQAVKFSSDLKLGHYMKIPPKTMFMVQLVATIVSSFAQIGMLNWMFANIPSLCTIDAINGFSCPLARIHFNGSILWGVVGPDRFFGDQAMYGNLRWAFLVGLIAPLLLWLAWRRTKWNILRKVNLPLMLGSLSWIPPATALNFSIWAAVCFVFNNIIKQRRPEWWSKYTMTLSAALDSGLAFGLLVVFFAFVFPGLTENFSWWGTEIYKRGCDWKACSWLSVAEGEHFGPPFDNEL